MLAFVFIILISVLYYLDKGRLDGLMKKSQIDVKDEKEQK